MRVRLGRALLAVLCAILASPTAVAWTIEPGVTLSYPNVDLTFKENTTTIETELTFESPTGPPIVDGFVLDFQPASGGTWAWDILNFSLPRLFVFRDGNTIHGRLELENLNGVYVVSGVRGYEPFEIMSPFHNFSVPSGSQTIRVQQAGTTAQLSGTTVGQGTSPYVLMAFLILALWVAAALLGWPWFAGLGVLVGTGALFLLIQQGDAGQASPYFQWLFIAMTIASVIVPIGIARRT